MAIKIYETQVKPTSEIAARPTTSGMRVSQATAAQIGTALNSSVKFLETYERGIEGFHNKYDKYRILIMIGLFLAYYNYLQIKRK